MESDGVIADVVLDWPAKELGGNSNCHWARKSKITKAHRARAATLVGSYIEKLGDFDPQSLTGQRFLVEWHFQPPDRRRRDLDNMLRACKAYQDGCFDVLPEDVDDCAIMVVVIKKYPPVKGGSVRMILRTL